MTDIKLVTPPSADSFSQQPGQARLGSDVAFLVIKLFLLSSHQPGPVSERADLSHHGAETLSQGGHQLSPRVSSDLS